MRKDNSLGHNIFSHSIDAICLHSNGVYISANPSCAKLFGYPSEEDLIGAPVLDNIHVDDRDEVRARIERRIRGLALESDYVVRGLKCDGTVFDLEIHSSTYRDSGDIFTLTIYRDVTTARRKARDLQESEARMRTLFDSSPDPAWIIEDNHFIECNAAAVALLGYNSRDELLFVHPSKLSPETQPCGEASFSKAERMMGIALEQGIHRFEWIHTRADGSNFPAEVTLSSITLNGRKAIYCTWRDISKRKLAELELQLAASVFHATLDGVMITDGDAVIISVNPAFTRITGYDAEDAIGQTPRLLKSNHQDHAFYAELWQRLHRDGQWQGELWNRRKNGEAYLQMMTISAIAGPLGKQDRFVSVFSDVTELRRKDAEIRHQAFHDALTDLPNRALLVDRLEHAVAIARRHNRPVALLFVDLDRFKAVNDTLGHHEGDRLLQISARRIQDSVRKSDTVGRIGGDEFVIIVSDFENAAEVAQIADKIVVQVSKPYTLSGQTAYIGASVGIALFPQDGQDQAELMHNADLAMYRAKSSGRGKYCFFDPGINRLATQQLEDEIALGRAIDDGEFQLYYQPKIKALDGQVGGVEALVRWHRADGSCLAPSDFMSLAEESGLILPLGYWIVEEACRQIAEWQARDLAPMSISLNLTHRQFHDETLPDRIASALTGAGISSAAIEVEVPESVVMAQPEQSIKVLHRLRGLGIRVSVDDFGTGYSSLAHLNRLPIDGIKIDRSFISDPGGSQEDAVIIRAIAALAGTLKLHVVAEGVETADQLAFINQIGCDWVQGFYYAPPLPPGEFSSWLHSRRQSPRLDN